MIIARYLEQYPEISVYDTYIDNGATGTNFHRPGFQQMLSDIEAGHVNCVIVKDLSRLGRNTIDTGYYIEQYFRIRSIRFIAVNENFDTAAPEDAHSGIIIPLRKPPAYHRPCCRRCGAADVPLGFRGRWPEYHCRAAERSRRSYPQPLQEDPYKTFFVGCFIWIHLQSPS